MAAEAVRDIPEVVLDTARGRYRKQLISMTQSEMPNFSRAYHMAVRGTESYAFLRSMKRKNCLVRCSMAFSTNWRIVKNMSAQPRPLQNPHWDSGSSSSATCCSLSWSILATTFPTTSSSAIPLQLSQFLRLPFLGIGTRMASAHSLGTCLSSHTVWVRLSSSALNSSLPHAVLIISGRMLELQAALPLLSLPSQLSHGWF